MIDWCFEMEVERKVAASSWIWTHNLLIRVTMPGPWAIFTAFLWISYFLVERLAKRKQKNKKVPSSLLPSSLSSTSPSSSKLAKWHRVNILNHKKSRTLLAGQTSRPPPSSRRSRRSRCHRGSRGRMPPSDFSKTSKLFLKNVKKFQSFSTFSFQTFWENYCRSVHPLSCPVPINCCHLAAFERPRYAS